MVDVNVDNRPVSISVGSSDTEYVPSGEVWKVTVNIGLNSTISDGNVESVNVNDNPVASVVSTQNGKRSTVPVELVLAGGDKITYNGSNGVGVINGFVVKE